MRLTAALIRLARIGYKALNPNSSNSTLTLFIPKRFAIGAYMSRVSRAIRRRLSGANTSKVRMLCSRSAIFTKITRRSLAIAMAIFWKFSACASARELKVILLSLLTPSTRSATVLPN